MISNYIIKKSQIQEEKIFKKDGTKTSVTTVNHIMSITNDEIGEDKEGRYCIEAIFEFLNEDFEKNFEKTKKVLKGFYKYDRENHSREDLILRL